MLIKARQRMEPSGGRLRAAGPAVCRLACLLAVAAMLLHGGPASAARTIGSVCTVKGQAENQLHGMGLVVGLEGTGDTRSPATTRLLSLLTQRTTNAVSLQGGQLNLDDLKGSKAVALVAVTATVPAAGAREGGKVHCRVHAAAGASSLRGGYLIATPLLSPNASDNTTYAIAEGPVTVGNSNRASGHVDQGCQFVTDIFNPFMIQDTITLVLKPQHSGFTMAHEVQSAINSDPDFRSYDKIARAVDARNVIVRIPDTYRDSPVEFIGYVLNTHLAEFPNQPRVVIHQREGIIAIDPDVYFRPTVIGHKNLTIRPDLAEFVPFDPSQPPGQKPLNALVDALESLKVPTTDVIEIIKILNEGGFIMGTVVID